MHQIGNFFLRKNQKKSSENSHPTTWIIGKEFKEGKKEIAIRKIATEELKGTLNPEKHYIINCSFDHEFLSMSVMAKNVIDSIVQETKCYKRAQIKVAEVKSFPSFYTGLVPTTKVSEFEFFAK
ncbi:MAG: hypothetical protein Q4D02_07545 [Clostridia bacterium]|nr:hypothetical protein [Clostridia bacterium]